MSSDVACFSFVGSSAGEWAITEMHSISGEPLPPAHYLSRVEGSAVRGEPSTWVLRGFTSNLRYTTGEEARALAERSPPLGRANSVLAALIPIRKSPAWWALGQDERRAIYEEKSRHTSIGLEYLPRIARKLHHCRDLGEPFDFLTWFEFSEADAEAFDELVEKLRASEEWKYVDREVDVRLRRLDENSPAAGREIQ